VLSALEQNILIITNRTFCPGGSCLCPVTGVVVVVLLTCLHAGSGFLTPPAAPWMLRGTSTSRATRTQNVSRTRRREVRIPGAETGRAGSWWRPSCRGGPPGASPSGGDWSTESLCSSPRPVNETTQYNIMKFIDFYTTRGVAPWWSGKRMQL